MPRHYKEMMDEIINKIDEDAPTNAVAHGGVDMNPTGKKTKLIKKKDDILKRVGAKIKENNDDNNIVIKGVNEQLNKLEDKIDKFSGIAKEEIKLQPEKETFHNKFIKDLK